MGTLNKYSRRDYINNVKWQNKDHDKFERILELYNYDKNLENKHKSNALREKYIIVDGIIELIRKYYNSFDFDIPQHVFKIHYKDSTKIEWQYYNKEFTYWYTLEKNKKNKWQVWIKNERNVNYDRFVPKGLMYLDYGYNDYDKIFKNTTLLSSLEDLKTCYNQLSKLKKYSIMEYAVNTVNDLYC